MKIMIDLPEELLHRARIMAVLRKTTLKEMVIRSLTRELESATSEREEAEALVAAFSRGNNTDQPVRKILRHEIHDRPILHRL